MPFAALRESIPATRDVVYLNTGFTGPSPRPVVDRVREVLEQESAVGGASPEGLQLARSIGGATILIQNCLNEYLCFWSWY